MADKSGVIINGPINKQFDNTLIASRTRIPTLASILC